MKMLLQKIFRTCRHLIAAFYRFAATSAANRLKKHTADLKRGKNRDKIKTGFIVQMPEVWDKEAPLFEAMERDERFDVYLIIVPHFDFSSSKLGQYGEEKTFFCNKYPDAKTILLNKSHDVIDDSFDYVFYQRCWESYLPEYLRCKAVIKHALTCYIPYCFHASPEPTAYYQTDFFRYLSRFYCCSSDQCEQVRSIRGLSAEYFGFPVLDTLKFDSITHKPKTILWTPRWTDDPAAGGTSFIRLKDWILELPRLYDNITLTLRPHPLTFENAIKEKWMTASEIENYKQKVFSSGAVFDKNTLIEETFQNTDILITDFTSSILPFFLSGRPIIYCTDSDFTMIGTFRNIIDSCYKAKNQDDLLTLLDSLLAGNDPLYEKRQSVIHSLSISQASVDSIMEDLIRFVSFAS